MKQRGKMRMIIVVSTLLFMANATAQELSFSGFAFIFLFILITVKIMPICHGKEHIWIFVLTLIGTFPVNVNLVMIIYHTDIFSSGVPVIGFLVAVVEIYLLWLAIEEIFMGLIGCLIWKRVYNLEEGMMS